MVFRKLNMNITITFHSSPLSVQVEGQNTPKALCEDFMNGEFIFLSPTILSPIRALGLSELAYLVLLSFRAAYRRAYCCW